jgi:hypothetical protein
MPPSAASLEAVGQFVEAGLELVAVDRSGLRSPLVHGQGREYGLDDASDATDDGEDDHQPLREVDGTVSGSGMG